MSSHLSFSFAKQHGVIATEETSAQCCIVYHGKLTSDTLIELQRFFNKSLLLQPVSSSEFEKLLTQHYENRQSTLEVMHSLEDTIDLNKLIHNLPKTKDLLESNNDAPIIQLINALFTQALKQGASDIHFETFEEEFTIRFRIDGILYETLKPPHVLAPFIISRIKVIAKLDIAEKRLPQDGRIMLRLAGRSVDVRVSTIPVYHGERIVLRLLDKQAAPLDLKKLGFTTKDYEIVTHMISHNSGILLLTGPTGSGKTTTLYAMLMELNHVEKNILTVEDPVEYYLPGIGQTQVNSKIDMTFARGLRAILRQDPDIVMVGEIRDIETAEMSIQASLTGHLVLSTLHTNNAIGAITRLQDLGVKNFLLTSTLKGIISQRLVRVLCSHCKVKKPIESAERELMGLDDQPYDLYYAAGCGACHHTGYAGRIGIYELIEFDDTLRALINEHASEAQMLEHVRTRHPDIREDGWFKVLAGQTTIDEVLRVI